MAWNVCILIFKIISMYIPVEDKLFIAVTVCFFLSLCWCGCKCICIARCHKGTYLLLKLWNICSHFITANFLSNILSILLSVLLSLWLYFGRRVKKKNWMINRSATIVWNASSRLLVQRNMLVYSLLSSAISVSLHCLRIWIKLCWISRCSENLSGPAAPRERALNEHPSNTTSPIPLNKKNARTQEEKSGQTPLWSFCSQSRLFETKSQFSQSILPPATLGPLASA